MITFIRKLFSRNNATASRTIALGQAVRYGNEFCRVIGIGEFGVTLLNDDFQKFENVPVFMVR